jgi:general secretion pathway protein M
VNWLRSHRRSAVIIGLTLLLPLYFYLSLWFKLVAVGAGSAERMADLTPRIARLQGLMAHDASLRDAAGEVSARLEALGYAPGQDPTAVAAELQAQVRRVLAEAGLEVSNSQVLPARKEESFDLVGLKVTAKGSLPALDAALAGLGAFRPLLLVESLDVFPERSRGRRDEPEPQEVTAVIELLALRRLQ